MTTKILIVERDTGARDLLVSTLRGSQFQAFGASNVTEAHALLEHHDFSLTISDVALGDESGLSLCSWLKEQRPEMHVLMMMGAESSEGAVAAMRAGASDVLAKPMNLDLLDHAVRRALSHRALTEEVKQLR